MKRAFLLLGFILTITSQNAFSADKKFVGYLKSGKGFCSIEFEKQNEYLYQLIYTSSELRVRAANIELENGYFKGFDEAFAKEGEIYDQLFFDIPILPKTYRIRMVALGDGKFFIEKKTSIFGQVSFKSSDVCITKFLMDKVK